MKGYAPGWTVRCRHCGQVRDAADLGWVRIAAASRGKVTWIPCPDCGRRRWHAVERTAETRPDLAGSSDGSDQGPQGQAPLEPERTNMSEGASTLPLFLILAGAVLIVVGLIAWTGALNWFGRLPGDLRIEKPGVRIYAPITSMILVSIVLSAIAAVARWLRP